MDQPLLRWGILGAANIAQKNWKAIWNSRNGCVTAVASRDIRRSRRFIKDCQAQAPFRPAPRAFGSYEELLEAPAVDAVYIPLPTGIRGHWVITDPIFSERLAGVLPRHVEPALVPSELPSAA